jgi:hypothetical protein
MTYIFAWNYTPDASVSPVKRAVQAYIDFRPKAQADKDDVWYPHAWENRHIAFYVDGKRATVREAARRLKELPVLTWAHPYHYDEFGSKFSFSPEAIIATQEMVLSVKSQLRSFIKCRFDYLSKAQLNAICNVLDFEGFAPYTKPPIQDGTGFAVYCDHASTACHLFGEALRKAGIEGDAANYHTSHTNILPVLGGGGNQRQTPSHVPGALDGKTTFLSAYTSGGPYGCLTSAEVYHGILNAPGPLWIVLEDYQPDLEILIKAAKTRGVKLLGLWGTDKTVTETSGQPDRTDPVWSKNQDIKIYTAFSSV